MFYIVMPDAAARQAMIEHLARRGILSVFHYLPLHCSPMGRRFGGRRGDCPVAEDVSERLLRLPFYAALTVDEQEGVCDAVVAMPRRGPALACDAGRTVAVCGWYEAERFHVRTRSHTEVRTGASDGE